MTFDDGFISARSVIWTGRRGEATITRGLELYGPAMESLSVSALHRLEDEWRAVLRMLPSRWRMQFRYSQYTDYREQLLAYYETTRQMEAGGFSQRQRNERYVRYAQAEEDGRLKASRCRLFIIAPIKGGATLRKSDQLLQASAKLFETLFGEISRTAQRLGGHTKELDDEDLFEEFYRAFNPAAKRLDKSFLKERFHPEKSILDGCLEGDVVPMEKPITGFYHAGQYHGCLALSALPQNTYSGMISGLTNADVHGFDFMVNLEGRDVTVEIEKAEKIKAKLERARISGSKHARLDHGIQAAADRIHRLASGAVVPMKLQLILHAFDGSQDGLQAKLAALRNIVTGMSSARTYEMALPTSCRNFYFAGLPGGPHREDAFWHLLDDQNAANLLPVCGDDPASLKNAEALYQA